MAEAWTGVMRVKPIEATASRDHSDSGGVRASHALEDDLGGIYEFRLTPSRQIASRVASQRKKIIRYRLDTRHVTAAVGGIWDRDLLFPST